MAIDLKYGRVTTERGSIGEDEPVVVFRAQDELLTDLLWDYRLACLLRHADREHIADIDRAIVAVDEWQGQHPTKVPDPIQAGT